MNKSPIGVFDSGLGGLTVLKEIMRKLFQMVKLKSKKMMKF